VTDQTQNIYDYINTEYQQYINNEANAGTIPGPLEIEFQSGKCYEVNGMLFLRGLQNVIIDGNGATFQQDAIFTSGPNPTANTELTSDSSPAVAPYCENPTYNATASDRNHAFTTIAQGSADIMWYVEGGCDLVIEKMTITSNVSQADAANAKENDAGFQVSGGQRVLITGNVINNVAGDCVTVFGLHEAEPNQGSYPGSDVTISNNTCNSEPNGRDGVSVQYAQRVTIGGTTNATGHTAPEDATDAAAGNTFTVPTDGVDVEGDCASSTGGLGNILIEHNSITPGTGGYPMGGTPTE
jgi:hypothetical protein